VGGAGVLVLQRVGVEEGHDEVGGGDHIHVALEVGCAAIAPMEFHGVAAVFGGAGDELVKAR
jgi:hypothetical protein